jgi:hypothetical protein
MSFLRIGHRTGYPAEFGRETQRDGRFWFFFSKKTSARGWWGAAGQAAARSRKKAALLFEKRSKNFYSMER